MTESTVQVPVSLIERAERFDRRGGLGSEVHAWLRDLRALLSQPTQAAEPPRIEDLPPEMRTAIQRADLVLGGFVQHDWASPVSVHEWYLGELRRLRDAIDPSTIRDVTPPKAVS